MSSLYGKELGYCADRKEEKDHGEKGKLLGAPISDMSNVLIIEDVTTAGTSIRQTHPLIMAQAKGVKVKGLIVSVDRQEKGTGDKLALEELADEFSMKCVAIVTMEDVVECLYNKEYNGHIYIDDDIKKSIDKYYEKYGR